LIVTALTPMCIAALWVQASVIEREHLEYEERLETAHRAARARWEQRTRDWQRFTDRLCEGEPSIELALRQLNNGRFGRVQRQRLRDQLPRLLTSLGLDQLAVIDATAGRRGISIAASFELDNDTSAALLESAQRTGSRPFVRRVDREARRLTFSCTRSFEDTHARIITAVRLDAERLQATFGEGTPVTWVARSATESDSEDADHARRVQTLSDAEGTPVANLVTTLSDEGLEAQIRELQQGFLGVGAIAALFALIFGLTMAGRVAGPLRDLESAAARVAGGDFETEIKVRHGGEIGAALRAFNEMTRTLQETRSRMLRAERVAAWREIARRIAHEIKNPLSPIQVSIETMRKTKAKRHPDFDEIFEESTLAILEEVARLKHIVLEFSRFARLPRPKLESVQMSELIEHVVHLHAGDDIEVDFRPPPSLPATVRADREQLTQVLLNLVQNGMDAARVKHGREGGRVTIELREGAERILVRIADNGPGIAPAERERIFEPYFTTKSHGTGLGLAIVLRIIEEHQGSIELGDGPSGGLAFEIELPIQGPDNLPATETSDEAARV